MALTRAEAEVQVHDDRVLLAHNLPCYALEQAKLAYSVALKSDDAEALTALLNAFGWLLKAMEA